MWLIHLVCLIDSSWGCCVFGMSGGGMHEVGALSLRQIFGAQFSTSYSYHIQKVTPQGTN
jgi:hypothetical protein